MADETTPRGDGKFSPEYVATLTAQIDRLKDELRDAKATHTTVVADAKREAADALTALRTEHKTALETASAAHTEAVAAAKTEGQAALTAANTAARQRVVNFALRAEGATAGLLDADQLKLLDPAALAKLDVDDAGAVVGAAPLIAEMKRAKPFLFGQGSTSQTTTQPPTQQPVAAKKASDMTEAEFKEAQRKRAWRS